MRLSDRMLLAAALLLAAAPVTAQTYLKIAKAAMSQTTFSKKDFVDTIKVRVFDGAVIVPVEIEGQPRHLLFDTGGQHGAYQKGIRTGDYLIEVNGMPITDPCTYIQMEGKDKETPMKFRSPDGSEKQVTVKRTY